MGNDNISELLDEKMQQFVGQTEELTVCTICAFAYTNEDGESEVVFNCSGHRMTVIGLLDTVKFNIQQRYHPQFNANQSEEEDGL
jgi:hypothetical protein